MERFSHRVQLVPGTDEEAFLTTGDAADLEVLTNLNNFDNWVILNLSEEEATQLRDSSVVESVEKVWDAIPYSYNVTERQRYAGYWTSQTMSNAYVPSNIQSAAIGNSGDTQAPMGHLIISGVQPDGHQVVTEGAGRNDNIKLGHFKWAGDDSERFTTLQHKVGGRYVDIVAVEYNTDVQTSYNADFENHENWTEIDPQTFNLTFTNSGSSAWLVSGTHRGGSLTNASNPTLQFWHGDKIIITNNADSSHPLLIKTQFPHGIPSSGDLRYRVSGNVNNTNGGTVTFYADHFDEWGLGSATYVCQNHGSMTGTISFIKPSASRLKKMNWSTYDSSLSTPENNQLSNSELFGYHSAAVLSSIGGLFTGYAWASDLRVAYAGSGVAPEATINAVINWHNSKPVNPETGVRNATVMTGAWGAAWEFFDRLVPVDDIKQVNRYTSDGTVVTTNRSGSSWNGDLSAFIEAGFNLRTCSDPNGGGTKWMVATREDTTRWTAIDSAVNSMPAGMYFFRSAGNSAMCFAAVGSQEENNNIVQEAGTRYVNINWSGGNSDIGSSGSLGADLTHYPLKTYDQGQPKAITIGAAQISQTYAFPDSYSCKGPGIDLWAPGAMYYASAPDFNGYFGGGYMDNGSGDYYSYFSGTSNAGPVAAGVGACFIEDFFVKFGTYPTVAQLRTRMQNYARPRMKDSGDYDWSNISTASISYTSTKLIKGGFTNPDAFTSAEQATSETAVLAHPGGTLLNSDYKSIDLMGSTNLHIGLPWAIDRGNNAKHITTVRGPIGKPKEAETGLLYPRYRKRIMG